MIKIKFQSRIISTGRLLPDEANVNSLATAREDLLAIIDVFNAEETQRYGDKAQLRELVAVDTGQEGQLVHDWHKKNLVGEPRAYGRGRVVRIVDTWQCEKCKMLREVRTLDGVPRGGACYPERTCEVCGKIFKDAHNLERHRQRCEAG